MFSYLNDDFTWDIIYLGNDLDNGVPSPDMWSRSSVKAAKEDLKNIDKRFRGKTDLSYQDIFKKSRGWLQYCRKKEITFNKKGKAKITLTYPDFIIVFDEAKDSVIITINEDVRKELSLPTRIIKHDAGPISIRYADEYFLKLCDLQHFQCNYNTSRIKDINKYLSVLKWLHIQEEDITKKNYNKLDYQLVVRFIDAQHLEVGASIRSFGLNIGEDSPYIKVGVTSMHGGQGYRCTYAEPTTLDEYQSVLPMIVKKHADLALSVLTSDDNKEAFAKEANLLKERVNNWITTIEQNIILNN